MIAYKKTLNQFDTWRVEKVLSSAQIKAKSSITGHPGGTRGKLVFTCGWGSFACSCVSGIKHTWPCFQAGSQLGIMACVMNDWNISLPTGEWVVTRTAVQGEHDLTWGRLRDYTVPTSHLLCPLAWGSWCGCSASAAFGERASSSFSCCTSSARCCSKSLFCSSSWWTRAWASIRAAVSAAIWSFSSCTWRRNKGQGLFDCVSTFFDSIHMQNLDKLQRLVEWLFFLSCASRWWWDDYLGRLLTCRSVLLQQDYQMDQT